MNEQLQDIIKRLTEAKQQRGRLAKIAAESNVTTRTIYALTHGKSPSASTVDKLEAYFTKLDRKVRKEKSV